MNVDRAAFLALTMSLAGIACASSDDGSSSSAGAISATGPGEACIINPTTESVSGPAAEGANQFLGFDPVNDFPAAESFCFDRVFGKNASLADLQDVAKGQTYAKCNDYGKLYVPWTMREAYQQILQKSTSGTLTFAVMYAIDKQIVNDATICPTPAAQSLCANEKDKTACVTLASQMQPAQQPKLTSCTDSNGFDVFTCAEGGIDK